MMTGDQMRTSVFSVQIMDCSSGEQLVQMRLATVAKVANVRIDLDERTVTVFHDTETLVVLAPTV
jgi:copper chaperone CopZ